MVFLLTLTYVLLSQFKPNQPFLLIFAKLLRLRYEKEGRPTQKTETMNRLLTFAFMLLTGLAITACQGDNATDSAATTAPPVTPVTAPGSAGAAAGVAAVEHYTCPAGHVGSGGAAAGACAQCGATLVHNQAFHGTQPSITPPASSGANPMFQDPNAAPATTTIAPPTEPAQNASGVWHYTCAAGCAGGGASASPCAQCGATLVHNTAYHN